MSRGRLAGLIALMASIGAAWWLGLLRPSGLRNVPARSQDETAASARAAAGGAIVPDSVQIERRTPPDILRYADGLNGPGRSGQDDVQLISSLLQVYRRLIQGTNPVGDNAEITAVLTGKNPLGYAFIRPDHPAISRQRELCDRWGTPYFFHQISGTVMEVRSAGPDRKHWTEDDFVAGP